MLKCFCIVAPGKCPLESPETVQEPEASYWLRLARLFAQFQGDWFMLSTELGLLRPDDADQPWPANKPSPDRPLNQGQWSETVLADLLGQSQPGDKLIVLSERRYEELVSELVKAGRQVETPLLGLSFAEQTVWLERRLRAAGIALPTTPRTGSDEVPWEPSPVGSAHGQTESDTADQAVLLATILEQMAEGVIVSDHEGRFQFFNQQAEALIGKKPNLSPRQWSRYFSTQQMDETGALRPVPPDRVPMIRALAGERVDNEELYLGRGRDHQGVWLSVNARPLRSVSGESMGAVAVCRDITDLKTAEQEARRAHRDFHKVIEASRDGVGIHREGRWVYLNPALLAALGYEQMADLCAIPLVDLLAPENRAEARDWLWAPIEGKLPPVAEFEFLRRDGTRVSLEVCPALLTEFEGDEAVLVVFRDITERKKLESQLMISDRMAALGTVASGVGHEINNPLSVVMMNLELALHEVQVEPAEASGNLGTVEMLKEALVAAQRVNRIVSDLKVLSLRDEASPIAVDLQAVLDSTAGVLLNEIRFRAVLSKSYAPDLPKVLGVEPKLAQVVLNLLLNAVQSLPEGQAESNSIVLTTEHEGDSVRFSVSDTGSGILPEVAHQMFTPFFSTKPVGTGSGLGLSLCYRIVTGLGGTISYKSEPGLGSTFFVSLPAVPVNEAPAEVQGSPKADLKPEPGRVLVVDDEPGVCRVLKRALGREHSVEVCEDGLSALQKIQEGSRYDVILCDVMMPQMTGLQLYEALAVQVPEQAARMVFLTGGAFADSARLFLDQTTRPVLYKPCQTEDLRAVVRSSVAETRSR